MLQKIYYTTTLFFIFISSYAQELYQPRDVKMAYQKGTRTYNGTPGAIYWQNKGIYDIQLTAAPPDRNVKGSEQITYINNSPDTLKNLVIKLIQNIHKPGASRNGDAQADYLTAGVQIDACTVNGKSVTFKENNFHLTWNALRLSSPLLPKDSVKLSFDWHFQASKESGREGMLDSTSFYLAYFYPRVAVYDDYNGWDRATFTDMQEFYNDFNDYRLTVNLPKNYIAWATGVLQNPQEVLNKSFADRLVSSMTSNEIIHIATHEELNAKNVTQQKDWNNWLFTSSHVPDVALCISDHYIWDASSVVVDDVTKRRASVQAAYKDNAKDFHYMVGFAQHALDWFSHNWPGVAYPYPTMTVCQGFADMEYPMMVNDNTSADTTFTRFVAEHEIAHSYFPFYMGINEHRYPFMDEGWATTLELLIGRTESGIDKAENLYKQFRVAGWINDKEASEDLPIITPATAMSATGGYGNNTYGKPSLGYLAMIDYLGEEQFKKCLHAYMDRWNGKQPNSLGFLLHF
jgi:Peptidase family M1 domain